MSIKKNTPAKKPDRNGKDWPAKITGLREGLGSNRHQFAKKLGVSHVALGSWEEGKQKPSSEWFIKLGNIAAEEGKADPLWFWDRAGISRDVLLQFAQKLALQLSEAYARFQRRLEKTQEVTVLVPLLKSSSCAGEPMAAPPSEVEEWLPLPAKWVANPAKTCILREPFDPDSSTLGGAEFAVVDVSQTQVESLWGHMVVVLHEGRELGGFIHPFEFQGTRLPVLLRSRTVDETRNLHQLDLHIPVQGKGKIKEIVINQLAAEFMTGGAVVLPPEGSWRIVGRVIARIARAPERR